MKRTSSEGKNVLVLAQKQSAFLTFLEEFRSPLIIILLGASVISLATGALIEGLLIIAIVVASAVLDFVVSYRSERAAEALARRVAPLALVIRGGKEYKIPSEDVSVGDTVHLVAGSIVPADASVIESDELYTNESALTGESVPVEKPVGTDVYMGSGVVSGEAVVRITAIGVDTKFAGIVTLLSGKVARSEFETGIARFSMLITRIVLVLALLIFTVNTFLKHDIFSSLIFALALAVGMTPELLPMIIAVNLSRASIRMAKKGVIVKKLSAIENFGALDVLCTDKTGTLTEDKISVVKYLDIDGNESDRVIEAAYVNSVLRSTTKTPLDAAIVRYREFPITEYAEVREIPFDFERRRDSMVVSVADGSHLLITKGAPEAVIGVSAMSDADKEKALTLFQTLSADGYRVLAIAERRYETPQTSYGKVDEHDLSFSGFVAFIDPPKASVKAVLAELARRNIEIKVVTGDHALVAEKIVREVGIDSKGTLDAADIDGLTEEALAIRAETTTIFSRVTPAQKNRIISAIKRHGHTVGYLGDGINDAPALRTADVGVSVDNAVDVAKDSADIVLLSKNLDRLVAGVVEGRKTFANTLKYISMAVSSNFGNMISMTVASVALPFLPMLPVQILLNNLIYDGSQFALIADRVDDDVLDRPTPWNIDFIKRFMIVFGLLSSFFDFATFFLLYRVFHLAGAAFQTGWFLESFITQVFVVFFIRTAKRFWRGRAPHPALVASAIVALALSWGIALSRIGSYFGFAPLPPAILAVIVAIALSYFAFVEIAKYFFYRARGRDIDFAPQTA